MPSFYDGGIQPRETLFGVTMRDKRLLFKSLLEARWALTFDLLGIEWAYEPRKFELKSGRIYTPDFYLGDIGWIEIKPEIAALIEVEDKLRAFTAEKDALVPEEVSSRFFSITSPHPSFTRSDSTYSTMLEWVNGGFIRGDKVSAVTTICPASARSFCESHRDAYLDHVDRIFRTTTDAYFDGPFPFTDVMLLALRSFERAHTTFHRSGGKRLKV